MNKTKKIILVLIATVAIFATFAINTFAYIIDGVNYSNFANVPSVSNSVFYDMNNDPRNPDIVVRTNASPDYLRYVVDVPSATNPTGDLNGSVRVMSWYNPLATLSSVGIDDSYYAKGDGVFMIRAQGHNAISSDVTCGGLPILSQGISGIDPDAMNIGVSIRGGAIENPNTTLTRADYKTFAGFYQGYLNCTDLVSGHTFNVGFVDLDNTQGYGGLTRYHQLNGQPLIDYVLDSPDIDQSHFCISLNYIHVDIDNKVKFDLTNGFSYGYVGFDVAFSWNDGLVDLTNGSGLLPVRSLFSPLHMAQSRVSNYIGEIKYLEGYDDGYNDAVESVGLFDFIIHGVEGFLAAELFPGFSFGILLMAVAGVGLFIWLLKIFAGG